MTELTALSAKLDTVLKKLEAAEDGRAEVFTGLLRAIESSMAEAVEHLEESGSVEAIKQLVDAIKAMKPPVIKVEALPAPLPAMPAFPPIPAPVINFVPENGNCVFELTIKRETGTGYGVQPIKSITITRKAAKP